VIRYNSTSQKALRTGFAENWIRANGTSWSQRRRLMAVLRRAHRVLGVKRDRLGLGPLGGGVIGALFAASIMAPQAAFGQVAIGNGTSTNTANCNNPSAVVQSVAIGCNDHANGGASTAVGTGVTVAGNNSVGLGSSVNLTSDGSIGIGYALTSNGLNAIAIGVFSNAVGVNALAVGGNAHANTNGASAFGVNSTANGVSATAIGNGTTAEANATAVGVGSQATASNSLALGSTALASGNAATSVGRAAQATGNSALALGAQAVAIGDSTVAVGQGAGAGSTTANSSSVAVGIATGTLVSGAQNTAMGGGISSVMRGAGSGVTGARNVAFGTGDGTVTYDGTLSASAGNLVTGSDNVAIGTNAGIGVTTNATTSIGRNAKASQTNGTAIGNTAAASNTSAIAIGTNTVASGVNAIAQGTGSQALSTNAVAIGSGATASGGAATAIGFGNSAFGNGAVALGDPNYASGTGAVAQGANNIANNDGTATATVSNQANGVVAIGNSNKAVGQGSVALGNTSSALAAGAIALGDTAVANHAGDVALGSGSATGVAVQTSSVTIGGTTYGFAGTTPTSTVSVGSVGAERTITNVAAGRISGGSTDAVNGSQLFATNQAVTANTTSIAGNTTAITNLTNNITGGTIGPVQETGTAGRLALVAPGGTGAAPGAAQTLTNVANGLVNPTSTYAINGSQLYGASNSIATNFGGGSVVNPDGSVSAPSYTIQGTTYNNVGSALGAVNSNLTTLNNSVSSGAVGPVQQTGTSNHLALVAPGGTGAAPGTPQTLSNVAPGTLSATSIDAVNGSQLYTTNQQVAQNTTDIAGNTSAISNLNTQVGGNTTTLSNIVNGGGVKYFRANSTLADSQAIGTDSVAVGPRAVANNAGSMALGNNAVASIDGAIALGTGSLADRAIAPVTGTIPAGIGFVPYNTSDATLLGAVSVGNATGGTYRQITNVADGTQAHDAVTLRQLQGAIGSVSVTPVQYFHANSTALDSLAAGTDAVAVGPTTVVNGDNGIGIGNGAIVQISAPGGTAIGQNAQVSQADAVALGTGSIADGVQSIAIGAGANSSFSGSVALGAGARTTVGSRIGYTAYGLSAPQSSAGEVSVGAVGAERQITNLAAGSAPTDAVNVSQLNQVAQNAASALGGGASYDPATGAYTGPTYTVGGTTYTNVGGAIAAQDSAVTNMQTDISNLASSIGSGGAGLVQQTGGSPGNGQITVGALTGGTSIDVSGTDGDRTISGVAAGVAPTDAVNVAQLAAAITAAADNGIHYDGSGRTSVTFNAGGAATTLHNIAAGDVSAASTDAVNGSQLYATNQQVAAITNGQAGPFRSNNTSGLAAPNATGSDAVAGGFGAVASGDHATAIGANSSATGKNSVALGYGSTDGGLANVVSVGSVGGERQITNVAAGTRTTDAVNVGQLNQGLADTLKQANTYTDSRLNALNYDLGKARRSADAGTASALAAAGLPQAFTPGAGMIAGAMGVWRDETAFAIGLSKAFNDGHTVVKGGGTFTSRSSTFGANVGIGYQF